MSIGIKETNPVTGLPGLRDVISWFDNTYTSTATDSYFSLSVYELPKYMYILENHGISAVDEMISVVAEKLKKIYGSKSYIGHISDDRFVVISDYSAKEDKDSIQSLLRSDNLILIKEVNNCNNTGNIPCFIELDYGFVLIEPKWQGGFEKYLKMANSEMLINHLKKDLSISNSSRAVLWKHEEVFRLLIEKNLFHYHFQPIVDAQNGDIFAYEALMRTEPIINMSPLEVLDVATNLGKLYDIEKATMSNVMNYVFQNRVSFANKKVFINSIPAHMLTAQDWDLLVDRYESIMDGLVVEMMEQTEIDDEHLSRFRKRLEKNNISLAIDDYGTGFSNLSNLIRYNPNYVKIDRALVQDIHEKPRIQKLVAGIVEFIHENGFSALAEGVENYDELKAVIDLGVDYIQGYYLAKPSSNILNEIDTSYRDEIIALNVMRSEFVVRVYTPAENEVVNLSQLATQHYNSILIDKENIEIEGLKGTAISCCITIKDGVKTNITLRDVSITTEKETPLINIGAGCDVTLNVEGTNEIINRGIRVPQDSSLYLTGKGSLRIHSEMMNSYAIGADKENSYGNITIEKLKLLRIDTNGENCVGIGGGKNPANSQIHIYGSGLRVECAGGNTVGIGCFDGNSIIEIQNSDLDFKMSCASAVGIGTFKGKAKIFMDNYSINIIESGNNLCGIGSLNNGEGNIAISNGCIQCDIRGRSIVCVGSYNGSIDCTLEYTSTVFYCEGNSVVGIGDMNGSGSVFIHDGNLNMTILAKNNLDIGSKNGHSEVLDCKRNIKINE